MKRGITMTLRYDSQDRMPLQIVKKRRKLTLEETQNLVRYEDGQRYCGHYTIFLNCSEEPLDGNGLFLEEPKGDAVDLYQIKHEGSCPVCGKYIPPFEYCPSCSVNWKDTDKDIEKILFNTRREAENTIKSINPNAARDCRVAWYWTYIGEIDMAVHLGPITDKRRKELYADAEELRKFAHDYQGPESGAVVPGTDKGGQQNGK